MAPRRARGGHLCAARRSGHRRRQCQRPTGAQLGGRFKRLEAGKTPPAPGWLPKPRIESPGHWVMVGAGTRTQTRSRGSGSPPPVSGPPLPRGPSVQVGDCKGVFVSGLEVTEVRSLWRLQRSPGGRAPKSRSPPPRGPGRAGLPRSPPLGGWSPLPGYPSLATPRLASTHPPLAGDSEPWHPPQLRDHCVSAGGPAGRAGGGARRRCQVAVQREAGREGGKHPCEDRKLHPQYGRAQRSLWKWSLHRHVTRALAPPVCSHSLSRSQAREGHVTLSGPVT